MKVTLQGMTENNGFVIVIFDKQLLQFKGCLGQPLNRKGDILNNHRGSYFTNRAHRREKPFADIP
jgi:hypothetical protein